MEFQKHRYQKGEELEVQILINKRSKEVNDTRFNFFCNQTPSLNFPFLGYVSRQLSSRALRALINTDEVFNHEIMTQGECSRLFE